MYGQLRGLAPTLIEAKRDKRTWLYADNGYLQSGHFDGYYRVTRNAYQIDGSGSSDGARFRNLLIPVHPWRRDGKHILLCPPSNIWADLMGIDCDLFVKRTTAKLKNLTDRPIVLRNKSAKTPLAADLIDAWALVTYSSNSAVEAAIAGIPVICLGRCAASAISSKLEEIENPMLFKRENWLGVLADNQWTLNEMRDGTCWRALNHAS